MENNTVIFDFAKATYSNRADIIDNFSLVNSGDFDICLLGSSSKPMHYKNGIHVWIDSLDDNNANLMILMSFILMGNKDWEKGYIRIFEKCREDEYQQTLKKTEELVHTARLPITMNNIEIIVQQPDQSSKSIINNFSQDAALTLIGIREEMVKHHKEDLFKGYDNLGTVLFVHSKNQKNID